MLAVRFGDREDLDVVGSHRGGPVPQRDVCPLEGPLGAERTAVVAVNLLDRTQLAETQLRVPLAGPHRLRRRQEGRGLSGREAASEREEPKRGGPTSSQGKHDRLRAPCWSTRARGAMTRPEPMAGSGALRAHYLPAFLSRLSSFFSLGVRVGAFLVFFFASWLLLMMTEGSRCHAGMS